MVFHTQGTGGVTMDEVVREQSISVVANLSIIEIGDYLVNGLFNEDPIDARPRSKRGFPRYLFRET